MQTMATKYLIVRGDDFGMCHGANQGTLRAFKEEYAREEKTVGEGPGSVYDAGSSGGTL